MPTKKEINKRSRIGAESLVDFANQPDPRNAMESLIECVKNKFNMKMKKRRFTKILLKEIVEHQIRVKTIFDETMEGINPYESELVKDYVQDSFFFIYSYHGINKKGIVEYVDGVLNDNPHIFGLVSFFIIKFFETTSNRGCLFQCLDCNKYGLSKRAGRRKFCDDICRSEYHNKSKSIPKKVQ